MLKSHVARYPSTRLVLVGFSMGGNIVTKYMSQPSERRAPGILGAVSICQGYDAQRWVLSDGQRPAATRSPLNRSTPGFDGHWTCRARKMLTETMLKYHEFDVA